MNKLAPQFTSLALSEMEKLPAAERADLLEFASQVLEMGGCPQEAEAAREAATNLREASSSETRLRSVLVLAIQSE